jgi:hypothetical protein
MMKITISTASPDALNHDTLILGFFSDERPPRGYCGQVDWRLNGMISREIADGRLTGAFLDKMLCAFPKRLRIARLLLFGLGSLAELTCERLYRAGGELAKTVQGIQTGELVLPIPAEGRGGLPLSGMAEALFTGLHDGFSPRPQERDALQVEIPVREASQEGVRAGLDLFRKRIGTEESNLQAGGPAPAEKTPQGPRNLNQGNLFA